MGIHGTGQPTLEFYETSQQNLSAVGVIYTTNIDGINTYRLQTVGAGGSNLVSAYGSLDGASWVFIGSVVGNETKVLNYHSYGFVKFETTTYGGTPFSLYWKGDPETPVPVPGQDIIAANPTISVVDTTTANTELSFVLPANTLRYQIKIRNYTASMKVAFIAGTTSGNEYISVPTGCSYREENIRVPALTLYFQCNKANQTVEILSWT